MPELPEVETIARTLAPQVEGRRIVACELLNPSTFEGTIPLGKVVGGVIGRPGRRGKLLLLPLAFGSDPLPPVDEACPSGWPFWNSLGPEPLEMDADAFAACFAGRRGKIKALLLDQSVLAGCGNIYADESLFRAGIRPDAQLVSADRLQRLHAALREVLLESIDACGSSIRDYRTARGDAGAFQNAFRVYGRSGETCLECGTPLESCRIAGRATVFCPNCQLA